MKSSPPRTSTRTPVRRWTRTLVGLLALASSVRAAPTPATTVINEGFESGAPTWSIYSSSASTIKWRIVPMTFGGYGARTGSKKLYCAGSAYPDGTLSATYGPNMHAVFVRDVDLSNATEAALTFWCLLPSIGAGDSLEVVAEGRLLTRISTPVATWTKYTFDLTPETRTGNPRTVQLRFVWKSNSDSSVGAGAYLDDVVVTKRDPTIDLVVQNVTASRTGKELWEAGIVRIMCDLKNLGEDAWDGRYAFVQCYLSANTTVGDADDILIGQDVQDPPLELAGGLAAGATKAGALSYSESSSLSALWRDYPALVPPGQYYTIVKYSTAPVRDANLLNSAARSSSAFTYVGPPALAFGLASQSFSPAGGPQSFGVTANVPWSLGASPPAWVQVTGGASGNGNGTVSYSVSPNTGAASRSALLTATGGGRTATHSIQQAGFNNAMLPSDGVSPTTRTPTFLWPAVSGATWYQLWIQRDGATFLTPWAQGQTWKPSADLPKGTYRWWVRGWSPAAGNLPWSIAASFNLPARVAGVPVQLGPSGKQASLDLRYAWNDAVNATWYRLYVSRSGVTWHDRWTADDPALGSASALVRNHRFGTYKWWVKGWSPEGEGAWTAAMDVQILKDDPTAPVLSEPVGTLSTRQPTFRWQASQRANWYRLYVSRGPTKVVDQWTQATSWTPPAALASGAHSWWVGAWNEVTKTTIWSGQSNFTTP